jgi:hypothetical protein
MAGEQECSGLEFFVSFLGNAKKKRKKNKKERKYYL